MVQNILNKGFDHEQARPDRDFYVEYHPENLENCNLKKIIFKIFFLLKSLLAFFIYEALNGKNFYKSTIYQNLNTPYDVKSIMHYQSNAFARSGTYTLLSKFAPRVILRNLLITDIDAYEIQLLYNCSKLSLNSSINSLTSTGTTIRAQVQYLARILMVRHMLLQIFTFNFLYKNFWFLNLI